MMSWVLSPLARAEAPEQEILPAIERSQISEVLHARIKKIRRCYNRGLDNDPSLTGKVVVRFTIGANGRVTESGVKSSSFSNDAVPTCIADAITRITFPEPKGGGIVKVFFPYVFLTDTTSTGVEGPIVEVTGADEVWERAARDLIEINRPIWTTCYSGIRYKQTLSGRASFALDVRTDGTVASIRDSNIPPNLSPLTYCVTALLREIVFPALAEDNAIEVSILFGS